MTVLVWAIPAVAIVVGWALRARHLRHRAAHRVNRLCDALGHARRAAGHAAWERDAARANLRHAVWELSQVKRLLAAAQTDVAEWEGIARAWQDRAVTHLQRPTVVLDGIDGEAAVQAAVAGLDEKLAELVREGA